MFRGLIAGSWLCILGGAYGEALRTDWWAGFMIVAFAYFGHFMGYTHGKVKTANILEKSGEDDE